MLGPTPANPADFARARAALAARLTARRPEIEAAVLARVYAVSGTSEPLDLESLDPTYLQGLRAAVTAALDYALAVVEEGEERAPSPPPALLAQARLAARNRIGLDTVLRRYSAGYLMLTDFLVEEVEQSGFGAAELQRLMRSQAALDHLLAAVGEEHSREAQRPGTSAARRAERIERLLAGELLDTSGLGYDFEGHQLGLIASGQGTPEALKGLAGALDRRLLVLRRDDGVVWGWLGGRRAFDIEELGRHIQANWPVQVALALGEPGQGLPGWRLSHRQARAALPIALRSPEPFTRYADVALLAMILEDELLATSLRKLYLEPLEGGRDGGEALRETLRAYFGAGCNVSSAAAVLGVRRHTVANRLRAIEEMLGRPLGSCGAEIEAALRLKQLNTPYLT